MIQSSDSTRDRLTRNRRPASGKSRDLGIVGRGGRASGVDRDVRRDHPYAAYEAVSLRCRCTRKATYCTGCRSGSMKSANRWW